MNFAQRIVAAQAAVAGQPVRVFASNQPEQAEILIYDLIGEDYWTGEGVTAKSIVAALKELGGADVLVRINSRGGDTMDGTAIYNAFADYKGHVKGRIEGYACSMMTAILCAFDEVEAPENILFMAHRAQTYAYGTAKDLREQAVCLEKVDQSIVSMYAAKTKKTPDVINALLDEQRDTWLTAQEAKDFGFIDAITVPAKFSACLDAKFANALAKDEGAMLLPASNIPSNVKKMFGDIEAAGVVRIDADFVAIDANEKKTDQLGDVEPPQASDDAGEPPAVPSTEVVIVPEVEPKKEEPQDPVAEERKRIKAIRTACKDMDLDDMADDFIDAGSTIDIVNKQLLKIKAVVSDKQTIDNKHSANLEDKPKKISDLWGNAYGSVS